MLHECRAFALWTTLLLGLWTGRNHRTLSAHPCQAPVGRGEEGRWRSLSQLIQYGCRAVELSGGGGGGEELHGSGRRSDVARSLEVALGH
jgi:hypothetical protein